MSERWLSRNEVTYRNQANGDKNNRIATAHLVSVRFFTPFRTYSTGVRSVKFIRMMGSFHPSSRFGKLKSYESS